MNVFNWTVPPAGIGDRVGQHAGSVVSNFILDIARDTGQITKYHPSYLLLGECNEPVPPVRYDGPHWHGQRTGGANKPIVLSWIGSQYLDPLLHSRGCFDVDASHFRVADTADSRAPAIRPQGLCWV